MSGHSPLLQPEARYWQRTAPLGMDDPSTYRGLLTIVSRLRLLASIALEAYRLFKRARRRPKGLKATGSRARSS